MRPHALLLLAAAAGTAANTGAQQLAVQKWSVRDGLAHSRVNCMFEDRLGYVWLGTWEGLSRFDGRSFVNFGTADGLPNPFVNCIAEDGDGALWVGTLGGGIARLGETRAADGTVFTASSIATVPRANDVFGIVFAAPGAWMATSAGVYRATWSRAGASFECALRHDKIACVAARDAGGAPVFFRDTLAAAVRDGALASTAWPTD